MRLPIQPVRETGFGWTAPTDAGLIGLAMWLGLAGCGGGSSPTAQPPPPPPAVTVSFEPGPLVVREGDTAEIRVRYQIRTLDAAWQLSVSPLPVTASTADFELSASSIEIPAGQGVSGEASLELAAVGDNFFDEGEETVAIRFVPGGGVNARLGTDLQVVIHDGGVFPCTGVNVVATRPAPGGPADVFIQRSFTFQVLETSQSPTMEFVGPYRDLRADPVDDLPQYNTNFAGNIAAWEVTTVGQNVEHTVDIQIRHEAFEDPDLELVFHGEGCDAHGVACSTDSCELKAVN